MSRSAMARILGTAVASCLLLTSGARADVVRFYGTDAIGNVRVVEDAQGNVLERHDYDPFGQELCGTPPNMVPCGGVAGQPLRFTGKERDAETGLDYFGARYYSSKTARFTTVDPVYTWSENLVDPQRWNRYAYGRNNPLRNIDPDGRDAVDSTKGFVVGLGTGWASLTVAPLVAPYQSALHPIDSINGFVDSIRAYGRAGDALSQYISMSVSPSGADQFALGNIIGQGTAAAAGGAFAMTAPAAQARVATRDLELTHGQTMSNRAFTRLTADVKANGIREPIKYVEDNGTRYVVDGNHRVMAARRLGLKEVPAEQVSLPFRGFKDSNDLAAGRGW